MKHSTVSLTLALVIAGLTVLAVPVEAQAPRTEWGDPDLRGLWTNATVSFRPPTTWRS